jgi:hypothetical protein
VDKKAGNIIKYVLSAGAAVVLLYFSFKEVKWADFFASLKACSWGYVLLSMFAGVCVFYFRALRWRELLLPIDPSTSRRTTFNSINIGYIANMVLPRVGEFVRCGYITAHSAKDRDGHPLSSYDKVLGTVVLERSWDIITMFLTLVLFLLFTWNRFGSFFLDKMLGPAFRRLQNEHLVWWLVLLAVTALSLVWVIIRFGRRSGAAGKVAGFFKGIGQGVVSCLKMKQAWRFFLWTAVIWSLYIFMSLSTLWAVQGISLEAVSLEMGESLLQLQKLGLVDAIFLMLAGSLASIIPVPGGFGAFHYIVALAISSLYGVPFQVGIIFATLSHESQVITQALCGGASYLDETLRKK